MISKVLIYLLLMSIITPATAVLLIDKEVYICKGPKSKKYHYRKNCRGLKRCSTHIYKVSLKEAIKDERTLCGWED